MLIGKGAGCFKCYFRKFLCLDNFFFVHFVSHKGGSLSIAPLLLGISLSFLGINEVLYGPIYWYSNWNFWG